MTRAIIRTARLEDCPAIVAVHLQAWQETYQGLVSANYLAGLPRSVERRQAWFAQAIASGQPAVWLAEREQQVLGFCNFGASRDADAQADSAEIMAIYLLAAAQRQGLGQGLLQRAYERLSADGYRRVSVWVLTANTQAIEFYQHAGFIAEQSSSRVFEEGGAAMALSRLSRSLPGA